MAVRASSRLEGRPRVAARPLGWLRLSFTVAVLGLSGSGLGLVVDDLYEAETPSWAAQAVGQDLGNLAVFAAMLAWAALAIRGSVRAYVLWLGTLVYSAYSYAIYAFDVRFGSLFLLYVAVFGMSVFCLIGGLAHIDARRLMTCVDPRRTRLAAATAIASGGAFVVLWLSELVPAVVTGEPPQELVDVGLPTNPVHVLDLGIFLPTAIAAGVLLLRRRPLGSLLVPVVLTAMGGLGVAILAVMGVSADRGLDAPPVVAVMVGALTIFELVVVSRFLGGIAPSVRMGDVCAQTGDSP
jgi:hypothetical protein